MRSKLALALAGWLVLYAALVIIAAGRAWYEAAPGFERTSQHLGRAIMTSLTPAPATPAARLRSLMARCENDPFRFSWSILGKTGDRAWWSRQREIGRAVVDYPIVVVPAGNSVGKSYMAADLVLWALYRRAHSIVFTSAPSQSQLEGVLWKEVRRSHRKSLIPLGGEITGSGPIRLNLSEDWFAYGHVSNSVERMSGHHAGDLIAIIDEGSGAPQAVFDAVNSLNPSRLVVMGNPLRPDGQFFELCQRAEEGAKNIKLIRVPSTESPHIDLDRSPVGMADRGFLATNREQYGESSLWWLSHVLALFPGQADDSLILGAWLNTASKILHIPGGPNRLAIDLAIGNGQGDNSVLMVRDDNGLLHLEHSRAWSFEAVATRAALLVQRFNIKHHHVTWDAGGIGADFGNRLKTVGIINPTPYLGGKGGTKFANLRTAAAWLARLRLDPEHMRQSAGGILTRQHPFAIRPEWVALLRPELEQLRYRHDSMGRIELEPKELMVERLRRSPDFADVFTQSFAFPSAA